MSTKTNKSKQKILLTTINLIKENGYDSVTLNDICTAANISKTTFYYYFESKDDLILQFYKIPNDTMMNNLTSIFMEENTVEQFWKLMEPMLNFIEDSGTEITKHMICALTVRNVEPFNISSFQHDRTNIGIKIIERAQSSGEIRNSSDPFLLFNIVQGQIVGIISFWCSRNGKFDFKNAIRLSIEVCFDVKPELRKASPGVLNKVCKN